MQHLAPTAHFPGRTRGAAAHRTAEGTHGGSTHGSAIPQEQKGQRTWLSGCFAPMAGSLPESGASPLGEPRRVAGDLGNERETLGMERGCQRRKTGREKKKKNQTEEEGQWFGKGKKQSTLKEKIIPQAGKVKKSKETGTQFFSSFWCYYLSSLKIAKLKGCSSKQLPGQVGPHCKRRRWHRTCPPVCYTTAKFGPATGRTAPGDVPKHPGEEGDAQEPTGAGQPRSHHHPFGTCWFPCFFFTIPSP